MIKISANISKKVPLPGIQFSSQQFGAAIEIEVSDSDKPDAIQARIHELYGLLSSSIDSQITGATDQPAVQQQPQRLAAPQPQNQQQQVQRPQYNGNGNSYNCRNRIANNVNTNPAPSTNSNTNGNGNGRRVTCTEAQAKCIFAICKAQGLDMVTVLADYNVSDARDLHVRDASRLIDQLKKNNNTAAQ